MAQMLARRRDLRLALGDHAHVAQMPSGPAERRARALMLDAEAVIC
jgi:hypothetical protein